MDGTKSASFSFQGVQFGLQLEAEERIISDALAANGVWEPNQLSLYASLIGQSGVFLDIGANVGVNAIFAKRVVPGARVVAVEPSSRNFALLQRNVADNVPGGIELHKIAIADRAGRVDFSGAGTNAHIGADPDHPAEAEVVECQTLDALVTSLAAARIDLIKIDVEGYTDVVLAGASRALSICENAIVEFSYGDIGERSGLRPALHPLDARIRDHANRLLATLGRQFRHFYYLSREEGLVELREPKELFELMFVEAPVGDVLATRQPRLDAITGLSFALRSIQELRRQNHFRILEIQRLAESGSR